MLLHHMTHVSFQLLRKNLGNLQEFLGKLVIAPKTYAWDWCMKLFCDGKARDVSSLLADVQG